MSRQSVAANRTSHAPASNPANAAAAAAKFLEKKKEFDAVSAFQRASALYLQRIEGLAENCETMADAGRIHGEVLEQWPRMFQILSLFLASREETSDDSGETMQPGPGQRLVRIPVEELQDGAEGQRQQTSG
ncbi:hypothetical protein MSAN_00009000 [Mycena sanguinolenta]|uniref:DASH complex subunit DAD2 n=1 Tax=Mycena sanguinolenta TaxID=230812 RepID=A0A8H6ZEA9_9AGAR|nr:hypothetical protein MSAN_00009000 [Mycena sanguinolenta]